MTLEHLPARRTEPRAVLLQAGLNRAVITENLAAKALGIARAGAPLPRVACVLRQ